jgi:LysR family glycine cleavage system transcriptional activator
MLDIDIASGQLITPLPHVRVHRTGYVALTSIGLDQAAPIARFVGWPAAEGARAGTIACQTEEAP